MRGVVTLIKQKMVGILKTVWSAMALKLALLLRIITVNGIVLMTLIARSFKNLFAWIVSSIKRLPVIRTIVEEYSKVEPMFVNKQAGQIGKLLLITVPLTLLLVVVHLSLGLYHALVAMMAKLLKRG